jgi:hypothetical protein
MNSDMKPGLTWPEGLNRVRHVDYGRALWWRYGQAAIRVLCALSALPRMF